MEEMVNTVLSRLELFKQLRKFTQHFSRGYKVAIVTMTVCHLDGTITKEDVYSADEMVAYLFDKSLSHSVCGMRHNSHGPFGMVFLVENEDNSTTNIDSHFIDKISKIEFSEEMKK